MGSALSSAVYKLKEEVKVTYDRRLEDVDYFIDSLPLGESSGCDGCSDNSLEDREAREEGNGEGRESHIV